MHRLFAVHNYLSDEATYGGYEVAERCARTHATWQIYPRVCHASHDLLTGVAMAHSVQMPTHSAAQGRPEQAALLQQPYDAAAELLNCSPDSIAIVNSATAAWQRVFLGLPLWRPGACILTSVAEYGSNYLAYLQVRYLCCAHHARHRFRAEFACNACRPDNTACSAL